jgi:hypothetical protein
MLSNHIQIVNWKTYLQILNCISSWPDPNPTVLCNLRGHNRTIRAHLIHVWFVGAEFLNMFICCCTWLNVLPLFGSWPMIYCWKLLDRYMQKDEKVCLCQWTCCVFVAFCLHTVLFGMASRSCLWNLLVILFSSIKNYDLTFFLWVAANILLECRSRKKRLWNMNWNLCCLRTCFHSWSLCRQILLLYCM